MNRSVSTVAVVFGVVVLAYFAHDVVIRILFPCDALFAQTQTALDAKVSFIKQFDGSVAVGERAVQQLTERVQIVAVNLKACCQLSDNGRRDPDLFMRCKAGSQGFSAGLDEVSVKVDQAHKEPQSADARAKADAAVRSALPRADELAHELEAAGGTPRTPMLLSASVTPVVTATPLDPTATPTPAPIPTGISDKPASYDKNAPTDLVPSEVVTGRVGSNTGTQSFNFWRIQLPPGQYDVVYDVARADRASSNIMSAVFWRTADGANGRAVWVNDIDTRIRAIGSLDVASSIEVTLAISNDDNSPSILQYWIGVFPRGFAEIPAPFFKDTPPTPSLAVGTQATVALSDAAFEAYYQLDLDGRDYDVTAEFTLVGHKGNVMGDVATFGSRGELLDNHACSVNLIGASGECKVPVSLVQPGKRFLRVRRGTRDTYRVVLHIEPR